MAICNGYPDISIIPVVGDCCANGAPYAINKLPDVYPQVLSMENIQDSYGYTSEDFSLEKTSWYVYSYTLSGADSTPGTVVESTCSAAPAVAEDNGVYYSYVPTVRGIQRNRNWIVFPLNCQEPSNGIVKGPAALIMADASILPSPTVTPALRVHVDNPWYNVLRASKNNWLTANPPQGQCTSGKWRLVYNDSGAFPTIAWECEEEDNEVESKSSYPIPSGSAGESYCEDLSISMSLVGLPYKTTVNALNKKENACYLEITYTWTGTQDFLGDDLYIYADISSTNKIAPKVYANFGSNIAGDSTVRHPLRGLGAVSPPGITVRKRTIRQPLYLFALPCENPEEQEDYAPCCEDPEENGIGDTLVEIEAVSENCGARDGILIRVSCDEDEESDTDYNQGVLDATLSFRNDVEAVSSIMLGECGQPLSASIMTYVCAHVEVIDGDYCSCNETESISISGENVDVSFSGSKDFHIPKGVLKEGSSFDLCVPIVINGDGTHCNGKVSASAFGQSAELLINNGCECEEEPIDVDINIIGDEYIEVIGPYRDTVTGKVTFELHLKNFEPCEESTSEDPNNPDEDEDEDDEPLDPIDDPDNPDNPDIPDDDPVLD